MNSRANGKRPYRSALRAARASDTRSTLLATAARLFAERGYVATSIDDIAREAGVSRATVFTSVGGKPALLKAAYDVALVGDDEAIPLVERPRSKRIRNEPDARRYLEHYAKLASEVAGRVAAISEVVRGAAGADPDARALYGKMQAERLIGARHIVGDIKAKGGLRGGLDTARAVDIVWTLIEPAIYVRLVHDRGWSARRYANWLAQTLQNQLLAT